MVNIDNNERWHLEHLHHRAVLSRAGSVERQTLEDYFHRLGKKYHFNPWFVTITAATGEIVVHPFKIEDKSRIIIAGPE